MAASLRNHDSPATTLAALRDEVSALAERVAALEKIAQEQSPAASVPTAPPASNDAAGAAAELTPETVALITAVLAAHLGVKPHIRQISLARNGAWIHTGRVTIQASHALSVQHD